ncbi:DUF4912 domain-containing protein [Alienimonas californiensis]|uniref:Rho termination factor-like N-terminal domain-containing protein n=1 Tax=Alienimonas californiensis TaxID=2527989 RepID=A0A517PBI8_9PLAN|nr:DUF4912 domain-containing protein [Alienimonas californiensis]QDT16726.1 hypothetical protein CA12_28320 [Alienimonas californiensis]
MSVETLRSSTRKDLAAMAKEHQVSGWHGMRKEELIEALMDVFRTSARNRLPVKKSGSAASADVARTSPKPPASAGRGPAAAPAPSAADSSNPRGATASSGGTCGSRMAKPAPAAMHDPIKDPRKDISTVGSGTPATEELDAVAHDPQWIHVRWVLKRCTVQRAAAGLGSDWHRAKPVLRLMRVHTHETKSTSETVLADVPIHGETDHWFLPVEESPATFRVQIGFLAESGAFFPLAKSRRVTTPRPGSKAAERVQFARTGGLGPQVSAAPTDRGLGAPSRPASVDPMFEKFKSLRADYAGAAYGVGEDGSARPFTVETELLIRGTADPDAHVSLGGDAVRVGPDGRFAVKMRLGDGRHVIPAVCVSPDRTTEQTVALGIARQKKVMEPKPAAVGV